MNTIWSTSFWAAAIERAVKTGTQVLAALLVADGVGLLEARWQAHLSVAGMSAVLSILSSIASAPFSGAGPSLTSETIQPTHRDEEMML